MYIWSMFCGKNKKKHHPFSTENFHFTAMKYYRVIALISANIVPSLDIEGHELASVRRYPNEGKYSPISVQ